MEWTLDRIGYLLVDLGRRAYRVNKELEEGGNERFLSSKDIVLKADREIQRAMMAYLRASGLPAVVYSEEEDEWVALAPHPRFTVYIDPLDGTKNRENNYRSGPYCALIAVVEGVDDPKYGDYLAAMIQMLNVDQFLLATRDQGCYLDGDQVNTSGTVEIEQDRSFYVDLYTASRREGWPNKGVLEAQQPLLGRMWPRDPGSSGYAHLNIASGGVDGFFGVGKYDDKVAGYAVLREAGGDIVDHTGQSFEDRVIDFAGRGFAAEAATTKLAQKLALPFKDLFS